MRITKQIIHQLLSIPTTKYQKFHEYTKIKKKQKSLTLDEWPTEWKKVYFKSYPRIDQIILPNPTHLDITLESALEARVSNRVFKNMKISLNDISNLLHFCVGFKDGNGNYSPKRYYPSPGGRYPIETYLISINSDLEKGVYHYNIKTHSLEKIRTFDTFDDEDFFTPTQKWIKDASILIVLTAVFDRNTIKYSDRGYRHILTEAGHIGQNIYLVCAAMKLACCGVGGYYDNRLNELIGVQDISESVINVTSVGAK